MAHLVVCRTSSLQPRHHLDQQPILEFFHQDWTKSHSKSIYKSDRERLRLTLARISFMIPSQCSSCLGMPVSRPHLCQTYPNLSEASLTFRVCHTIRIRENENSLICLELCLASIIQRSCFHPQIVYQLKPEIQSKRQTFERREVLIRFNRFLSRYFSHDLSHSFICQARA